MSYSEIYTRRNWQNDPDTSTPLDADNLNAMDAALKTIDTRVVNIGNDAMYASDVENCLNGQPTIDQTTGIITFPKKGGGSYTLDTLLEKIITNWTFDAATQSIILTLPDGSTQSISLSSFIAETEFVDTSSIAFTIANHQVQAVVKDHSIGDQQMQTSYKAECEAARDDAEDSADASADSALDSEAWATGKRDGSDVSSTDPTYNNNSKYYSEQADALGQAQAENSEAWANGTRGGVDVPSTDPAYHNNAKYWKDQAQAITNVSFAGLIDTNISNPQDSQVPVYNATTQKWENKSVITDNIFICHSFSHSYTIEETPAEVLAAYEANKQIVLWHPDIRNVDAYLYYPLSHVNHVYNEDKYVWTFSLMTTDSEAIGVEASTTSDGTAWDSVMGIECSVLIKPYSATSGHLVQFDTNGIADSGKAVSDFLSGTVGVANGGTGATTLASGAALIGNGTGAVQTRAITNNTAKTTAPAGSTNLATMNSLLYGMQNYNNRASAVNAADANYSTYMARGIAAGTTDLTAGSSALTNGLIYVVYE